MFKTNSVKLLELKAASTISTKNRFEAISDSNSEPEMQTDEVPIVKVSSISSTSSKDEHRSIHEENVVKEPESDSPVMDVTEKPGPHSIQPMELGDKSEIWNYYTKDDSKQNAICNICENSFKYSGSTSTLWSHMTSPVSEEFDKRFNLNDTLTNKFENISTADFATYLDPRYKNIDRKMDFRLKVKYELEKQNGTMSEEMDEMITNSESEANKKSEINILFPEDSGPSNYLSKVEEYF
ncbi:unnamed protein product [Psylliodes chrysocephalus]|uniref:BED-type domain-containing protein n=1 Tax=Psylliodes chrysocephalus TaxID=3402493 RepID=A0A9P0CKQ9_9CUCU|nr:unnamed protein product [Psylliodes chrysocephala]